MEVLALALIALGALNHRRLRRPSHPEPPAQRIRTGPLDPPHRPRPSRGGSASCSRAHASDLPAAAWGLWGAVTIAAAQAYSAAATDVPARRRPPEPDRPRVVRNTIKPTERKASP